MFSSKKKFSKEFYRGIAHRGLHDKESTENGLSAFRKAIDAGIAFELDIHLTKDGRLIVCHDGNLKRTTGKDGVIEELTYEEIKKNYRLLDGEEVPSFDEVLDLNNERSLIVTELKVDDKKTDYKELGKAAKKILKRIKNKKKIVLISFDPRALLYAGHRFERSLLVCHDQDWTWKFHSFFESVDLEQNMVEEPRVKKYRKHGGVVNVWTIENENELAKVSSFVDTVTFQLFDYHKVIEDRENYLESQKKI